VIRTDAQAAGELTAIGPGRYRARLARTGVQLYGERREFRDASDVFDAASLVTIPFTKICVGHNEPRTRVGAIRGPIDRVRVGRHEYLTATLEVFDADVRKRIDSGELVELSAGYDAEVEVKPGFGYDGSYDARQTRIRWDHLALLPRGHARCGCDCSIVRADSDAQSLTARSDAMFRKGRS
jgi:hypothetical protein